MASMSDSDDDIPPYSDLSSVSSDSSDRVRGNLFIRVLSKADRVRGKTEDLLNDIHESYSFDLDPEYRLKLQKRFTDGVSAPSSTSSPATAGSRSRARRGGRARRGSDSGDGLKRWRCNRRMATWRSSPSP